MEFLEHEECLASASLDNANVGSNLHSQWYRQAFTLLSIVIKLWSEVNSISFWFKIGFPWSLMRLNILFNVYWLLVFPFPILIQVIWVFSLRSIPCPSLLWIPREYSAFLRLPHLLPSGYVQSMEIPGRRWKFGKGRTQDISLFSASGVAVSLLWFQPLSGHSPLWFSSVLPRF